MVKALSFKGDKKPKKRKRQETADGKDEEVNAAAQTHAEDAKADEDDSWVAADATTDISGPVLLVLPSSPPTCIACDVNGSVFASELENLIEGDAATAEPHDVRQVWVATRLSGSEHFNFKGHHGRYLSCDKFGILSASREAISNEENFLCKLSSDQPSTFSLQTERAMFVTTKEGRKGTEVRGDAEEADLNTVIRIRMQARFKPRLKASKEEKAREKVSRKELEQAVGRRLEDDEVRRLKRARKEGGYYEAILDARVKNKHDKYS